MRRVHLDPEVPDYSVLRPLEVSPAVYPLSSSPVLIASEDPSAVEKKMRSVLSGFDVHCCPIFYS